MLSSWKYHSYLQVYGVPGAVNSPGYQYGQLNQNIPVGHSYTTVQGYSVPGSHIQSPYPSASADSGGPGEMSLKYKLQRLTVETWDFQLDFVAKASGKKL
ncbi:hypothetical protein YC2023_102513 [Brassica napus]